MEGVAGWRPVARARTAESIHVVYAFPKKDLDLFELKSATHTPMNADGSAGEPQTVAEFWGVSEEKLNALPTDKLVELRNNGALMQIYAHLISLHGWDKLIALQIYKNAVAADAAAG